VEHLDRYLQAVKRYLPKGQHNDIIKELSENLLSAMEDREAELGRPLDEAEQTAILERHGDPLVVAGRYRSDQRSLAFGRQLIGPEWFPFYLKVLWLSLVLTVVAVGIIALALGTRFTAAGVLVPVAVEFGIVTLVFALLDRGHRQSLQPARLLEQYLQAVREHLPKDQADDIIKELSENLRSQMDDKEAELGRPLAEAEQDAILTQHGHPIVVAGRYRQDQRSLTFGRQLIGPVLFPLYLKILLLNLALTLVACVVAVIILAGRHPILQLVPAVLFQVLLQFGIVTLVFALVEASVVNNPGSWNQWSRPASKPAATDAQRVPRSESALQLVVLAVFLLGLQAARDAAGEIFGSATTGLTLAPVWHQCYLAIVVLAIAEMAQACVNLIRPDWTQLRSVAHVAFGGIWLFIVCVFLGAGEWVVLAGTAENSAEKRRLVEALNQYLFYSLLIVAAFSTVPLLLDVRKLIRRQRDSISTGQGRAAA